MLEFWHAGIQEMISHRGTEAQRGREKIEVRGPDVCFVYQTAYS